MVNGSSTVNGLSGLLWLHWMIWVGVIFCDVFSMWFVLGHNFLWSFFNLRRCDQHERERKVCSNLWWIYGSLSTEPVILLLMLCSDGLSPWCLYFNSRTDGDFLQGETSSLSLRRCAAVLALRVYELIRDGIDFNLDVVKFFKEQDCPLLHP